MSERDDSDSLKKIQFLRVNQRLKSHFVEYFEGDFFLTTPPSLETQSEF